MFSHIRKLKNVKRVKVQKEQSKDKKKQRSRKNIKNKPQQKRDKIDHESDANSNATTIYFFFKIRLCAACPKCHNPWGSNNLNLTSHALNFMLLDRE